MPPNFKEEKKLWKMGYQYVAGIDEVGVGPIAGNITAAAVVTLPAKIKNPYGAEPPGYRQKSKCLPADRHGKMTPNKLLRNYTGQAIQNLKLLREIKDSKQLSPKKREEFYKILTRHPQIVWATGSVSEKVIDEVNIFEANKLAMKKAVEKLGIAPDFLILDGRMKIDVSIPQKSIVKADEKVFSCAAASIIAKVTRDRLMKRFHRQYPQYGFDAHKGYATRSHIAMLRKYGACEIHRRTFDPVRKTILR